MFIKKLFLANFVVVLVACGGGSRTSLEGNTGTAGNNNSTDLKTLTGIAAKGLLSQADVQAFQLISGKFVPIGTPQKTAADGSYSLADLPATTDPVIVKVTVNASTTMLDEITGNSIVAGPDLPVGFSMRSFVPDLTNSNEVHIQPFTELAISAAESSRLDLSGETLSAGKDLVVQLLGVNPFTIEPRDPKDASTMSSDRKK